MSKRNLYILLLFAFILARCNGQTTAAPETDLSEIQVEGLGIYTGDISTPKDEVVGGATLERSKSKMTLTFTGCCLIPGNAYTIWWVIGPVDASMDDSATALAAGFVQEDEEFDLEMERLTIHPAEGVRAMALDHGPDTGNPAQVSVPEGGCTGMCPTVLTATFPSPVESDE